MFGINLSGAEFGTSSGDRYGIDYHYPSASELAWFAARGVQLVRLPFTWERMQPTLGGELSTEELGRLKTFLANAEAAGIKVIIDLHNYGRYDGQTIGSSGVSYEQFADFWKKLAGEIAGSPALIGYDIMNEPHSMGGADIWPTAAQMAVDAIRTVDMETAIYVEGDHWATATFWNKWNANLLIDDPADNIIYEAHLYFDATYEGKYANSYDDDGAYPMMGVDRLQPFLDWLEANNVRGFVGEFGVPSDDPRWLEVLENFLEALKANDVGGTMWGGGFWWSSTYVMDMGDTRTPESSAFQLLQNYLAPESPEEAPPPPPPGINGTDGADRLSGTSGADQMTALNGDDVLLGSAGADTMNGGGGTDLADYQSSAAGTNVDLMRPIQFGGDAEGDMLLSIENIAGSNAADRLAGDSAVNRLLGRDGDDLLTGRGGADHLDGGAGLDTASYVDSPGGVDVALDRSTQLGGDAQGDVLISIERVIGSEFGDVLRGSLTNEQLLGGGGDDLLHGSVGADLLDGGSGIDRADYALSSSSVMIDLAVNLQSGGHAEGDRLYSIENVTGSAYKDVLLGNNSGNNLSGGPSADVLNGRGGTDILTGGDGPDRFVFDSVSDAHGDTITDFGRGDRIDLSGIDANGFASGDQAFSYLGAKDFSGKVGQLRSYTDKGLTYLEGDINGDGVADFQIILFGDVKLNSGDLIL